MWTKRKLLAFSFITVLLILLLLELVFRIVFAVEYKGYHTSVYVQGNTLQMSDNSLIFRNRPFYLDYNKTYQFNEEGMRSVAGDVRMPVKTADDFWVFLFGGSAMEGSGSNKDGEWLDITGITDHAPQATIAALLQQQLQRQLPMKKVRVFNAANTGYAIYQSRLRYEALAIKYEMDWVVSMDGENEPANLAAGAEMKEVLKQRWRESPLFDFPLNTIIAVTSHSAFANKLKQAAFNIRSSSRLKKNKRDGYPARKKWSSQPEGQLAYANQTAETERATAEFLRQLQGFDSLLTSRKQKHLLYIQPHLSLRDKSKMNEMERALFNYYAATYNDPYNNLMRQNILQGHHPLPAQVRSLAALHAANEPVFADYCHFTAAGNRLIALRIASDIVTAEKQ